MSPHVYRLVYFLLRLTNVVMCSCHHLAESNFSRFEVIGFKEICTGVGRIFDGNLPKIPSCCTAMGRLSFYIFLVGCGSIIMKQWYRCAISLFCVYIQLTSVYH